MVDRDFRPIDDTTRIDEVFEEPDGDGFRRCRKCANKLDGPDPYFLQHIAWHMQVG